LNFVITKERYIKSD